MDFNYGVFIVCLQEPSLFAVAKLLETGLVNMDRIEILWRPLTGHLLEVKSVAKCTHLRQYKQLNAPKELFIFRGSILIITLLPLWAGAWLHLCLFKTILRSSSYFLLFSSLLHPYCFAEGKLRPCSLQSSASSLRFALIIHFSSVSQQKRGPKCVCALVPIFFMFCPLAHSNSTL